MVRPLCDSEFLFGLHDAGGEQIMLEAGCPGWVLFTEQIGHDAEDASSRDYGAWAERGLGVIVRLNNGYDPSGTIPPSSRFMDFARRCGNFVRNSQGCHTWIIGNEMNYAAERPSRELDGSSLTPFESRPHEPSGSPREAPGRFSALRADGAGSLSLVDAEEGRETITPQVYAQCYRLCRDVIKAQPGHSQDRVLTGAVAPWNDQTKYDGNLTGDWVLYFQDMLALLGPDHCDGMAIHAYTHGGDPDLISSDARLAPPFQDRYFHFYTYRDFMAVVPESMRHLPVYVTETDQDDAWRDENSGWVSRAYGEIARWNEQPGNQQIKALILYRWSRQDRWAIEDKQSVIDDFRQAMQGGAVQAERGEIEMAESMALGEPMRIPRPSITDMSQQLPRDPQGFFHREASAIRYLVINHTGGPADLEIAKLAAFHRERGYPGLAYHYVVAADGAISQANAWTEAVSGQGYLGEGLNVAIAGKFDTAVPSDAQLAATARLCAWLLQELNLPIDAVKGVSEFVAHGSPGAEWLKGRRYKDRLVAQIKAVEPEPVIAPLPPSDGDLETLRARVAELQTKVKARDQDLGEQQGRLAQMEKEVLSRDARIGDLQGQVNQLMARIAALQATQQQPQTGKPAPAGVSMPEIHDVVDQLPKHPTKRYETRDRKTITHICIHHSAVSGNIALEDVARYHINPDPARNKDAWPGIGYHFYVKPDGTIYQTNRVETMSYHVSNNNHYTVGVCVSGDFTYAPPLEAQVNSAARLVAWLMQELNVPLDNVKGHKEFPQNDTSCPGETWLKGKQWKTTLLNAIATAQIGSLGAPLRKPLSHYLLFWQRPDAWAQQDWEAAEKYVGRFRPSAGFSVEDAKNAEFVTVVGGVAGVSFETEQMLQAAGCKVERLAGVDFAGTKRLLDQLADSGRRFQSLPG